MRTVSVVGVMVVVWITSGVSLLSGLGLDTLRSQIAVGSSWAAIAVLYITGASLRQKNIDPNFWVPDE